eukprot:CAMPEP_0169448780 /NCGR_PEP_ID=MMETSP1042-20121227/12249_1 /TAXON_ID=464988 /ORGANISM="Hemiselmis andersenii, Strain CCMP1180" /LENGTH=125 /DNA_ID=CAMNT_0009560453 /DNA_START=42 /DNA_END=419 /DNA_ORIENTATION=-
MRQLRELAGGISKPGSAKTGSSSKGGEGAGGIQNSKGKRLTRKEKKPAFPEMAAPVKTESKEERARRRALELAAAADKVRENCKQQGASHSQKVLGYRGVGVKPVEKKVDDSDSDDSDLDGLLDD